MRVAVWVKTFPPQYETFIVNQITGLLDHGLNVDVFAARRGGAQHQVPTATMAALTGRVHFRPSIPSRRLHRWAKALAILGTSTRHIDHFLRVLARRSGDGIHAMHLVFHMAPHLGRGPYDIVHCQYGDLGALAVALRSRGVLAGRIITAVRGHDMNRIERDTTGRYRRLLAEGDLFLPVSDTFRHTLIRLGCDEQRIAVHRSGIQCGHLQETAHRSAKAERPTVITVGRLVEKKGHAYALRAVAQLRSTFPALKYVIIGGGPLRHTLEDLVATLGLRDTVEFTGWLTNTQAMKRVAESHVFVLSAVASADGTQEGIPNSLKEAMVMGVPVVSTRHAGIPELVEHGISGFLAPERDVNRISDCIAALLQNDHLRTELGKAARRTVMEQYDSVALNRALLAHYATVARPAGSTGHAPPSAIPN